MLLNILVKFPKINFNKQLKNSILYGLSYYNPKITYKSFHSLKYDQVSRYVQCNIANFSTIKKGNQTNNKEINQISKNNQINKQIAQLAKYIKNEQAYLQFYNKNNIQFNIVNYTTYLKYLIRFNFSQNSQLHQIYMYCYQYIYDNIDKMRFRTFCSYLQLISQDQYRLNFNSNFIDNQKINSFTEFIIQNFQMHNIQDSSKSLKYLKKIVSLQQWNILSQKIQKKINISKFLNINQKDNVQQYFTDHAGTLNQLLFLYDALDNKPEAKAQDSDQAQVANKIQNLLFAISGIIQQRLQFSEDQYKMFAMLTFLKKHIKNISNIDYIQNTINNVIIDLKKEQRVKVNSTTDFVSFLQILKLSSDLKIVKNNPFIFQLIQDFAMDNKIQIYKSKQLNRWLQQLQFAVQQQKTAQKIYYLRDFSCSEINIVMSFYSYYKCWNPQVFSMLQQTFFQLLNNIDDKSRPMNAKNVTIYCKERSKIALNAVKDIYESESKSSTSKKNKNNSHNIQLSLIIQNIKKSYNFFEKRMIQHLQIHPRSYKQVGVANILKHCQIFQVQFRKLSKKLAKLNIIIQQQQQINKNGQK